MIDDLKSEEYSVEFQDPVPWEWFGLTDYPIVIKKPKCLNDVVNGVKANTYSTLEEVKADIDLIWENCKLYNM